MERFWKMLRGEATDMPHLLPDARVRAASQRERIRGAFITTWDSYYFMYSKVTGESPEQRDSTCKYLKTEALLGILDAANFPKCTGA
jgi:hypothetical protein